jgi:hypothetical protein
MLNLFLNDVNHCSLTKWEVNKAEDNCCDDNLILIEKNNVSENNRMTTK